MNKTLIIIGIVVIVAVVGVALVKGTNSGIVPPVTPPEVVTTQPEDIPTIDTSSGPSVSKSNQQAAEQVSYTNNGFTPVSITVKLGGTVTWTNNSDNDMWVASSPHPAHTDYPGFDELESAGKGKTYTFTFTKAGTWKYHNHLNAGDGGAVVVTP